MQCTALPLLLQVGHMSWGQRFELVDYRAYDIGEGRVLLLSRGLMSADKQKDRLQGGTDEGCGMHSMLHCCRCAVRGATLFGQGLLKNGVINIQSGNQGSLFPGSVENLPQPIAGFQASGAQSAPCGAAPLPTPPSHCRHRRSMPLLQWYDTRTMTIIVDTSFVNFKYQPQLGFNRPQVFYVSGELLVQPKEDAAAAGVTRQQVPDPVEHDAQRRVQAPADERHPQHHAAQRRPPGHRSR